MKKDKWLKWKIGAVGMLGLGFLFHEVKSDPAFAKAQELAAASGDKPKEVAAADPVMNEWQNGQSRLQNGRHTGAGRRGSTHSDSSLNPGTDSGSSGTMNQPLTRQPSSQMQTQTPQTRTQARTGRS